MLHKVDGGVFVICYTYSESGKICAGWMDVEISQADEWDNVKRYVTDSITKKVATEFVITSFTRIQ